MQTFCLLTKMSNSAIIQLWWFNSCRAGKPVIKDTITSALFKQAVQENGFQYLKDVVKLHVIVIVTFLSYSCQNIDFPTINAAVSCFSNIHTYK